MKKSDFIKFKEDTLNNLDNIICTNVFEKDDESHLWSLMATSTKYSDEQKEVEELKENSLKECSEGYLQSGDLINYARFVNTQEILLLEKLLDNKQDIWCLNMEVKLIDIDHLYMPAFIFSEERYLELKKNEGNLTYVKINGYDELTDKHLSNFKKNIGRYYFGSVSLIDINNKYFNDYFNSYIDEFDKIYNLNLRSFFYKIEDKSNLDLKSDMILEYSNNMFNLYNRLSTDNKSLAENFKKFSNTPTKLIFLTDNNRFFTQQKFLAFGSEKNNSLYIESKTYEKLYEKIKDNSFFNNNRDIFITASSNIFIDEEYFFKEKDINFSTVSNLMKYRLSLINEVLKRNLNDDEIATVIANNFYFLTEKFKDDFKCIEEVKDLHNEFINQVALLFDKSEILFDKIQNLFYKLKIEGTNNFIFNIVKNNGQLNPEIGMVRITQNNFLKKYPEKRKIELVVVRGIDSISFTSIDFIAAYGLEKYNKIASFFKLIKEIEVNLSSKDSLNIGLEFFSKVKDYRLFIIDYSKDSFFCKNQDFETFENLIEEICNFNYKKNGKNKEQDQVDLDIVSNFKEVILNLKFKNNKDEEKQKIYKKKI